MHSLLEETVCLVNVSELVELCVFQSAEVSLNSVKQETPHNKLQLRKPRLNLNVYRASATFLDVRLNKGDLDQIEFSFKDF